MIRSAILFLWFALPCLAGVRPEVLVRVSDRDGANSLGSGCHVATTNAPETHGLILTAEHVVRDWDRRTPIQIRWHDGQTTSATVFALDATNDVAALLTDPPEGVDAALMADDNPDAGTVGYLSGWAHGQQFRVQRGRVVWGSYADTSMQFPALTLGGSSAIQGQSGGPIWCDAGVVGVVSGSDGQRTVGCPVGFARRWLLNLGWRLQTGGCANGYCTPYTRPQPTGPGQRPIYDGPAQRPTLPQPKPQPEVKPEPEPAPEPCPDVNQLIADAIGALPQPLARNDVESIVSEQIAQYQPSLDPKQLAVAIQPHLDPITIQIHDRDGAILDTDTQRLGGTFRFRLILKQPNN